MKIQIQYQTKTITIKPIENKNIAKHETKRKHLHATLKTQQQQQHNQINIRIPNAFV